MVEQFDNAGSANYDRAAYGRLFAAFDRANLEYSECEEDISEDEGEISRTWVHTKSLWLPREVIAQTGYDARAMCNIVAQTGDDAESRAHFVFFPRFKRPVYRYQYSVRYGMHGIPSLSVRHGWSKHDDNSFSAWRYIDSYAQYLEDPREFVQSMAQTLEQPQSFLQLLKYGLTRSIA